MARPLRFLRYGAVYRITARTYDNEFRLSPSPAVNLLVRGALLRAAERTGVLIFVATCLGNHLELLVGDPCDELSKFMEELLKELSHRLNRMRGTQHSNFPVRFKSTEIGDRRTGEEAIVDILCNPVRARLVHDADDWPGFSTLASHRQSDPVLTSAWPSRRQADELDEDAPGTASKDSMQQVQATLGVPPFWPDLTPEEAQARICELVDAEQARLQAEIARKHERVVGPNHILAEHWRDRPEEIEWREVQPCKSSDPTWDAEYREWCERQTDRYKHAAKRWRRFGEWGDYPPGSFPPGWRTCTPTRRSVGPRVSWLARRATGT